MLTRPSPARHFGPNRKISAHRADARRPSGVAPTLASVRIQLISRSGRRGDAAVARTRGIAVSRACGNGPQGVDGNGDPVDASRRGGLHSITRCPRCGHSTVTDIRGIACDGVDLTRPARRALAASARPSTLPRAVPAAGIRPVRFGPPRSIGRQAGPSRGAVGESVGIEWTRQPDGKASAGLFSFGRPVQYRQRV